MSKRQSDRATNLTAGTDLLTSDVSSLGAKRPSAADAIRPIAFVDLKAQQNRIRSAIDGRIRTVMDHGQYVAGPEIAELEDALAARTGAADVVLCSSGTEALEFAMMAEGTGPGDAVFIPGFTYNATASAVLMVGATPVFVDVNERTFNMAAPDLARKVNQVKKAGKLNPRLVIPVDLFGLPADYPAISKVAQEFGLFVLADAAQSFGGGQEGRWVGNLVPMTATSFFPAKPLGCYGDGGAIFSQSRKQADILRSIRWHGTNESHTESVRPGTNGRLDTLQAAILLVKLTIFDEELERRKCIAALYQERLGDRVKLPICPPRTQSGWSLYSILLDDRDRVQAALTDAQIASAIYYKQPLHRMKAFKAFAPPQGLPVSEKLSEQILSLPIHPYLTDDQVHHICDTVLAAL